MNELSTDIVWKSKMPASVENGKKLSSVSDKYSFIDTKQIISKLEQNGYYVTQSDQIRPRIRDPKVVRHFVRMRHAEYLAQTNGTIPEILIVNAHDGSSSLKFMAGLFRMICSNGLIVQTAKTASARLLHRGNASDQALELAQTVIMQAQENARRIEIFRSKILAPVEILQFATIASREIWSGKIEPKQLLLARRHEDTDDSLWSVFNRVQENLIKGGIAGRGSNGRRTRTRGISSNSSIDVNQKLWQLAEDFVVA